MTDSSEASNIHVPEGFPALAAPTRSEDKIPQEKIRVEYIGVHDIGDFAAICYEAFPDLFWDGFETSSRPPLEERVSRLAQHFKPWLSQPGYHALKATHSDTDEVMAVAAWHENGKHHIYPTTYPLFVGYKFPDSFIPCTWRDDLVGPLGFAEKEGWSDDEVEKLYSHHRDAWFKEFESYDIGRLKEMGEQPHWYLAPLCVKRKYWAKGVGKALLMWGLDRADASNPPQPCVLESLPNARPVYYHHGFRPTAHHGSSKDTQLVRPAKMISLQ